jgi:hypothetical protein
MAGTGSLPETENSFSIVSTYRCQTAEAHLTRQFYHRQNEAQGIELQMIPIAGKRAQEFKHLHTAQINCLQTPRFKRLCS